MTAPTPDPVSPIMRAICNLRFYARELSHEKASHATHEHVIDMIMRDEALAQQALDELMRLTTIEMRYDDIRRILDRK